MARNNDFKAKHALIMLVAAYCCEFIGALFKLEHWVYSDAIIIFATILKVMASIILLIKLLSYPKLKDFLNW